MMKGFKIFAFAVVSLFGLNSVSALEVSTFDELKDCFSKEEESCVVTKDIVMTDKIRFEGKITLDLNGHTIRMKDDVLIQNGMLQAANGATFVLNDSKGTGVLTTGISGTYGAVTAINYAKNGKTTTVTINGGTLYAEYYAISGNGLPGVGNTDITVNGGKLTSGELGIYNPQIDSKLTINGGEITALTGIEMRAGDLTINGGKITATHKPTESEANNNGSTTLGAGIAVAQHTTKMPINVKINGGEISGYLPFKQINIQKNSDEDVAKIKLAISGGKFIIINDGTESVYSENFEKFVTGGTFTKIDSKYVPEKHVVNKVNNLFEVTENKVLNTENATFTSKDSMPNEYTLVIVNNTKDAEKTQNDLEELFKNKTEFENVKLVNLYDINVTDGTNVVPMSNGSYTITIKLDKNLLVYDNYKVIYVDNNGNIKEEIDAKVENEFVTFTTTHLSTYGVVGYNNKKAVVPTVVNPKTGDNVVLYSALLLVSALGSVVLVKKYN